MRIDPQTGDPLDVYGGKASTLAALPRERPLEFRDVDGETVRASLGKQGTWMITIVAMDS